MSDNKKVHFDENMNFNENQHKFKGCNTALNSIYNDPTMIPPKNLNF